MTKNEVMNALTAKGVTFDAEASKADLERLLNDAQGANSNLDDLRKLVEDLDGFSADSDAFKTLIKSQKEREFPDFGRDVPEGEYICTGKFNVHQWKNPRTENVSNILTTYLVKDNNTFETAAAAFCAREFEFVQFAGKNDKGQNTYKKVDCKPMLPFYSSTADRNAAVGAIEVGTSVKVCHARGHFNNPYNVRIFDFTYTWVEKA